MQKSHVPTSGSTGPRERISRRFKRFRNVVSKQGTNSIDLNKLHNAIFSLEKELTQLDSNGKSNPMKGLLDIGSS